MLTLILVAALLLYFAYRSYKQPKGFPPGPLRIPFVGSLLQLDPEFPTSTFYKWYKEHGDIYGLKLGTKNYVVLSDPLIIKKTFNANEFVGRPDNFTFQHGVKYINSGILSSWGRVWQDNRRYALRHLRDLGLGKSSIEDVIMLEIKEHIKGIADREGKLMEISWDLNTAITNIIWWIVAGKRFPHDSPKIWTLQEITQKLFMQFGKTAVIDFYPWLLDYCPRKISGVDKVDKYIDELLEFYQEEIDQHTSSFEEDEEDRNFIDMYLRKMKKEEHTSGFNKEFEDFNLKILLGNFFVAGGETTYTTLRWAFLYLIKYPRVQEKIHQELDKVVGRKRMPTLDDKSKMTYLEAFINEVHRYSSIASIGVFHAATEDAVIEGYSIPKGTIVVPLIYASHNHSRYWKDPDQFRPERFLDSNGNLIKNDALMPFSLGKRQCLGEALARTELFLFLSSLLQQFTFEAEGGPEKVDLNAENESIVRYPKIHQLIPKRRTVIE